MSTPVQITDGNKGTKSKAGVSKIGQLIVAPFAYDDTQFIELAADNTAYNFYKPKVGEQFVITGLRAKADRQVSNTVDADVVIYEASSPTSLTADKILHQEAMIRGDSVTLNPTNILVSKGKYVNAKTTDDDIHMTIMGYYIPA